MPDFTLSALYESLVAKAMNLFGQDSPESRAEWKAQAKAGNPDAKQSRARLIPQKKVVTRGGKTFLQTFLIDPLQRSLFDAAPAKPSASSSSAVPKSRTPAPIPSSEQQSLFDLASSLPAQGNSSATPSRTEFERSEQGRKALLGVWNKLSNGTDPAAQAQSFLDAFFYMHTPEQKDALAAAQQLFKRGKTHEAAQTLWDVSSSSEAQAAPALTPREMGARAFHEGKHSAPALDKELVQRLTGNKPGESIEPLAEWSRGYAEAQLASPPEAGSERELKLEGAKHGLKNPETFAATHPEVYTDADLAVAAQQLGLKVGDRKSAKGVTYELNKNHRWERVADNAPQQNDKKPLDQIIDLIHAALPENAISDAGVDSTRLNSVAKQAWEIANRAENGDAGFTMDLLSDAVRSYARRRGVRPEQFKNIKHALMNGDSLARQSTGVDATPPQADASPADSNATAKIAGDKLSLPAREMDGKGRAAITRAEWDAIPSKDKSVIDGVKQVAYTHPQQGEAYHPVYTTPEANRVSDPVSQTVGTLAQLPTVTHTDPLEGQRPDYSKPLEETLATLPEFGFEKLVKSTKANRQRANDHAVSLMETLEREGRPATPTERDILAAYTGEGGLSGDLNAHYTPTQLAATMWHLLTRAGFNGGRVLEPSMGAGVFLETAPANARMTGVEYSDTTGRIAKLLHPQAEVHPGMSFEAFNRSSDAEEFDAIIANPPYGVRGYTAADDRPDIKEAETYFMTRTLDRLREDGVAAFLTNHGPAENDGKRDFRAQLLARCKVIGCYQLPVSTFKDSNAAGPPVVWILKKRDHVAGLTLSRLVHEFGERALEVAGVSDQAFLDGTRHLEPDNMVGTWDGASRTGNFLAYKDIKGDLNELLPSLGAKSLEDTTRFKYSALRGEFGDDSFDSAHAWASTQDKGLIAEGTINGNGTLVMRNHRWHSIYADSPALADGLALSRNLREYAGLVNNGRRGDAEARRLALNTDIENYLETHGNPHNNKTIRDAAKRDLTLNHLLAAVDKNGALATHLTDALANNELGHDLVVRDDPSAVATYLAGRGQLTPENHAQLWSGASGAKDSEAYLYSDPSLALTEEGRWTTAANFYTGDVIKRAELMEAAAVSARDPRAAQRYQTQAAAYREAIPRKSLEDFIVTPRDAFIPSEVIGKFAEEVIDPNYTWKVENRNGVYYTERQTVTSHGSDWRNSRRSQKDLPDIEEFRKYLNYARTVERADADLPASVQAAARKAGIERARNEDAKLEAEFKRWLAQSDYREMVEEAYNTTINSYIPPLETGAPLPLEKWSGPQLHGYQADAVRHVMREGAGIMALDVGLGKTHAGAALAESLLQEGRAKRVMISPPKGLMGTWRKSLEKDLPHRRVLIIGQTFDRTDTDADGRTREVYRDDGKSEVAQKLALAATGAYDIILISRPKLSMIPLRAESVSNYVANDVEEKMKEQMAAEEGAFKGQGRRKKKKTARDEQSAFEKEMQKAASRLFGDGQALYWDDLGIDALISDEAHAYKNLHSAPQTYGESPKFMGGGGESKRSYDYAVKASLVRERMNGQGVYALTATPTKNSPLEIFNMLKPLTDAMSRMGIGTTQAFVNRYCQFDAAIVPKPNGEVEARTAMVGFRGLQELRGLMGRFMYRRTAKDVNLKIPDREDIEHTFEMSESARATYADLAHQAQQAAGKKDVKGDEHLFSFFGKMRKLTLDPTLHNSSFAGETNPRFQKAAEIAKNAIDENGKCVMFMDMGSQAGSSEDDGEPISRYADLEQSDVESIAATRGITASSPSELRAALENADDKEASNAYDRLVQHLVDGGVKREHIEVVTASTAKSSDAREAIKERFNAGQTKIVIGSTGVIGEGFSLQRGTTDMVHLDTPWDPGTYWQRLGRAVRQGNTQEKVRNHILLAKGSFDGMTYTTMLGKRGWMDNLYNSADDAARNDGDGLNYEDVAVMLSSNPEQARATIAERKKKLEDDAVKQRQLSAKLALSDLAMKRTSIRKLEVDRTNAASEGKPTDAKDRNLERYRREADIIAKRIKGDADLPAQYQRLLEPNAPQFAQDKAGNVYTEGGTFDLPDSSGVNRTMQITAIDHIKGTLQAQTFPPDGMGRKGYNLSDLTKTLNHTLEPDKEAYDAALHAHIKNRGLGELKSISLERQIAHAPAIHAGIAAYMAEHGKGRGAHVIRADGTHVFHPAGKAQYLEPGERYATGADAAKINQTYSAGRRPTWEEANAAPLGHSGGYGRPYALRERSASEDVVFKAPVIHLELWRNP